MSAGGAGDDGAGARLRRLGARTGAAPVALFVVLFAALVGGGRTRMLRDPGVFWHVTIGEEILARGLPHTDAHSAAKIQAPWIASQWLGEIAMAIGARIGGWDVLLVGAAALLATTFTGVAVRARQRGLAWRAVLLLVALAIAASAQQFHARPMLVTIELTALTQWLLLEVEAGRMTMRHLVVLPPLFAAWANVHPGVLGGIVMVTAAGIGWVIAKKAPALPVAALVAACALAAFATPYGPAMPRAAIALVRSPIVAALIVEHRPLDLTSPDAIAFFAIAALYLAVLVTSSSSRRPARLLPSVWLVFALLHRRHAPLFALTAVLAIAETSAEAKWLARWRAAAAPISRGDARAVSRAAVLALPAVVVALALALVRGWASPDPSIAPVSLLPALDAFAASHREGTPIFDEMAFGGFLIAKEPRLRVSVDDRCELYGDRYLGEYLAATASPEAAGAYVDAWTDFYDADAALTRPGSVFDAYLSSSPHWTTEARAATAVFHRRRVP